MTPYDGSGYGQSMYWRKTMKEIAAFNGEACDCWKQKEPLLRFEGTEPFHIKVECQDKCDKTFTTTENELTNKFLVFYKV